MATDIGPGTRVECTHRGTWSNQWGVLTPEPTPKLGGVYKVTGVDRSSRIDGLVLSGLPLAWDIKYFRPIPDRDTNISVLREAIERGLRGEPVEEPKKDLVNI